MIRPDARRPPLELGRWSLRIGHWSLPQVIHWSLRSLVIGHLTGTLNHSRPALDPAGATSTSPVPTRLGHRVIFFASALAVITYVDRVCISQAAPQMRADLGLTATQMGMAFSAFGWAYALCEVPSGWLGDWIGPRKVLLRVVVWWSLFT